MGGMEPMLGEAQLARWGAVQAPAGYFERQAVEQEALELQRVVVLVFCHPIW